MAKGLCYKCGKFRNLAPEMNICRVCARKLKSKLADANK